MKILLCKKRYLILLVKAHDNMEIATSYLVYLSSSKKSKLLWKQPFLVTKQKYFLIPFVMAYIFVKTAN